jgi:insulysin
MKKILILIIYLFSFSNLFSNSFQTIEDKSKLKLKSPSMQVRQTKKIRLSNGMKVYLISDKLADKSACAIGVLTGSFDDPKEYPGMAHFLEHMLFKGSEKYPDESEYFKFIFDNAGTPNAFTAPDRTVYMFSINHNAFEEGLDRISHFFIDPIFDSSHIQRELHAVDQEHAKNIENDPRRIYMISKEISNKNHPNSKFATGNSETLSKIPPNEIKNFFEKNYSSNLMTLVVYSDKSIEELQKLTVDKFSKIKNLAKDPSYIEEKMFLKDSLQKEVFIKPITNQNLLSIEFEIDKSFANDKTKAFELIAYVLNRGQKNSLSEVLKKDDLIEDITASYEKLGQNLLSFSISAKLTDKGIKNKDFITQRIFEAINNIKKKSVPTYLFYEMNNISKLNYEYQSRKDAFDFVVDEIMKLMDDDFATYPDSTYVANNFDIDTFNKAINQLTLDNSIVYIITDPKNLNINLTNKEKYTNAEYKIADISNKLKKTLQKNPTNSNIALPNPNPFIPTNLKVIETKNKDLKIEKIIDNEFATIFFKKDETFKLPEVSIKLSILDPLFTNDLEKLLLKNLYIKALLDSLDSTFLAAKDAGLYPEIYSSDNSINISINGYSEKAEVLLEDILKNIKNLKISKDKFNLFLTSYMNDLESYQKIMPFYQANDYLYSILLTSKFSSLQLLNEIKNITYQNFLDFQKNLFKNSYINGFISGNLTIKDAESIYLDIKDTIALKPYLKKDHIKKQVLNLQNSGPYILYNKTSAMGNSVVLLIEENPFTFKNKAAQTILSQALKEAFFTELRSKQKTAYIAHAKDFEVEGSLFQYFAVQSNTHDVYDLLSRFEIFIDDYLQELNTNIDEKRFNYLKNTLITQLETPSKNLTEENSENYNLAFDYNEDFELQEKKIKALQDLTYEDFLNISKTSLGKQNKKRVAILFEGEIPKENKFSYKEVNFDDFLKNSKYKEKIF